MNVKMTEVMNMMQTELNRTKSGYILMGSKEQIEEARKRMEDEPMVCGDFQMKELKRKMVGRYCKGRRGLEDS